MAERSPERELVAREIVDATVPIFGERRSLHIPARTGRTMMAEGTSTHQNDNHCFRCRTPLFMVCPVLDRWVGL
jgi:hypothetical protein